jgi:hypothetical protein
MRESAKTAVFCLAALVLAVAAAIVEPEAATPDVFSDQGEIFFPRLTDPLAAKALEVVEYDEATATARPFKVEFKRGRWTIPSHYNYPADAKDRLAKTAAALVDLRKDQVRSDLVEDHARYSVIDPLDQKVTSLTGRGKRVTLRDEQGHPLADLILGQTVKDKPGYRHVRLPGQKRTYAVKTDADPSARFEDWIETDLLKVSASAIRKVTIHSYSINEAQGRLENVETLVLTRDGDKWKLPGAEKLNTSAVNATLAALDNLKIVGVRPKPPNLTQDLKTRGAIQMSLDTMMSLRQKGFFITPDGRLLSNEGEMSVETADGVIYTLRFGEILTGQGEGPAPAIKDARSGTESRYLFITVGHTPAGAGQELARQLTNRFADWYYVISGADFTKLRPKRKDLAR